MGVSKPWIAPLPGRRYPWHSPNPFSCKKHVCLPPDPARVENGCGCNADGGFPVGGTIGETRNDEGVHELQQLLPPGLKLDLQ